MRLFRDYAKFVNPAIHVIWVLLMVVGISSAYFHATLSLIGILELIFKRFFAQNNLILFPGQLLDELAILWVLMSGFCLFFPRRYFPSIFKNDRKRFSFFIIWPTLIATGLALVRPAINAFALMSLGVPAVGFLILELRK